MTLPRRPIRVSFTAKTLSGVTHLTDFVLPPVVGTDLVSEVEVVLNGERTCRLAWSVELREGDPFVLTFDPATIADLELPDEDDEDDDEDDEDDAPPPAEKPAKKPAKAAKKVTPKKPAKS